MGKENAKNETVPFMDGPKQKNLWLPQTKNVWIAPFVAQISHWDLIWSQYCLIMPKIGKSQEKMATVQKDKKSLLGMPVASPGIQKSPRSQVFVIGDVILKLG